MAERFEHTMKTGCDEKVATSDTIRPLLKDKATQGQQVKFTSSKWADFCAADIPAEESNACHAGNVSARWSRQADKAQDLPAQDITLAWDKRFPD